MVRVTPPSHLGLREIETIAGRQIDTANASSALAGLSSYGYEKLGLNRRHRLAQFLAQVMHESQRFRYDREIWGPTPAQKRYDTRTDLGNTAAVDGDGRLYAGRAGIQITGKANYREFTDWARARFKNAPDFVAHPEAVNTDPWEGLAAMWYWETRKLNVATDAGNTNEVTRRINGGQNGLADRRALYVRAALVLLGYGPDDTIHFQMDAGLSVDGVAGPATHAALHRALLASRPIETASSRTVAPAPASRLQKPAEYGIIATIGALVAHIIQLIVGGLS